MLAAVLAAGILSGCQNDHKANAPLTTADPPSAALSVTLQTRPANPRQMDPVKFSVTVADRYGKPVPNARVSAELVMPAMEMGRNTVAFQPAGDGAYSGAGRFTMNGDWNVVVTASVGKDKTMRPFPVTVR